MNIKEIFYRGFLVPSVFLAAILASGCATTTPILKPVTSAELARILDGSALSLDFAKLHQLPDDDVIGLTDDMKQFVDRAIGNLNDQYSKLYAIIKAVLSPQNLGLEYGENAIYTAAETFKNRRANCLSFTTMLVAMLRYAGLHAEFNDVDIPPVWDLKNNNTLVKYRHVNAIVTWLNGSRDVVDIDMDGYDIHFPQHPIRDKAAVAQFFSNRGLEYLLHGNTVDSFRYLRKALELDPGLPFLWTNLGAFYGRQGLLHEAEIADRYALQIEPKNMVAISNIARIYKGLGRLQLAAEFERRAKYFRERNPYYLYKLAMDSFLAGDYPAALGKIHTAIMRNDKEHRFFFLQGAIYKAMDKPQLATESFNRAIKLSANEKQADIYRRKIKSLL